MKKIKLVKENLDFQRGQTAKKAAGIGIAKDGIPSKEELMDYFFDELWEETEQFINDTILESLFRKFENFRTEDAKEAFNKTAEEVLDTWKQTTNYKF